ncbi:energy-coupling factor transporter transmembrane component T family protein [Staphylococcus durrellii]|uniref:energy-coupling factor transporter transmembrane component T family protein n=1 Tax=Staphylococcus durrellii TaxID=2781773 RepID=UPI00189FD356|nr:energy-coupling factor transporter transmembrane component T [Staphylococcus durrellii]MBF7017434.1 energy-coupling factor transporter transmembrane protein EcfT [Staphylococcus durrellii]
MFDLWKTRRTFLDDVNIITKLALSVLLFFLVILIHKFDLMIYMSILMVLFLILFSGIKLRVTLVFVIFTMTFSIVSALFMIFYGNGTHMLFKLGFIQISIESLVRGLHLSLRTMTVSFFGLLVVFSSQIVMIFYSLMQHLKIKPKFAYAFMAAIRMVPIMLSSFVQLRRTLKMRYQMIPSNNYKGLNRFKHLLIPLLSQNIRKAHHLSVAMEKKGFKDGPRTYYYYVPFSYKDIVFVIIMILVVVIAFTLAHYVPITNINDVRVNNIY